MLSKKRLIVFGVASVLAVASCFALSGCSGDDAKTKKAASTQEEAKGSSAEEAPASAEAEKEAEKENADAKAGNAAGGNTQTPAAPGSQNAVQPVTPAPAAPEDTKYGDAEVYTNDAGNPAAKTEDGVEVEITSENMGKLIEDYQKVQGSGSEEEKALLDQIQVLLEVSQAQGAQEAQK